MHGLEAIFPVLFPFFFVGMWLVVARFLRSMSGMTDQLEVDPGPQLRSSGWGSASINGVTASNCAKIQEYQDGFVVRMMWIFGGGVLWLPKAFLRVSEKRPRRFIVPRSRILISGMNQVILYGKLADLLDHLPDAP
jgi:hypothetical protein